MNSLASNHLKEHNLCGERDFFTEIYSSLHLLISSLKVTCQYERDVQANNILLVDKFEVRLGSLSEVCAQEGDTHESRITSLLRLPQHAQEEVKLTLLDVLLQPQTSVVAYLHHDCILHIIHRDIKSSNILLDQNLEARVSDFGLATLMEPEKTHVPTVVAGTFGYLAPVL